MFAIANGRKALWQWDLNQQLTVAGSCTEVHYLDKGAPFTLTVAVKDGKADIPNILLQKAGRLVVYAYIIDAQDHHTKICETFGISARPKPDDYVYTETEVKTWSNLQSQIGDLADLETEAKENLVAAINEAAETKAAGGTDISLGLTSASVGQIIKVKAVDESGKPTAWEAAGVPSGGDMPLLYAATLEEAATTIIVNKDPDGNALSLSRWKVCLRIPPEFADYATPIYIYCVDKDYSGFAVLSKNIVINDSSGRNIAIYESVSEHMTRGLFHKYDAITTSDCHYYENGVKSTAIKLYTYDADKPFPVGTFVEVYGK